MTEPRPHAIFFEGKGRTKQSFKKECDINNIMKNFGKTGNLPHQNPYSPQYGDFSNVDDYQAAVNQVNDAMNEFMELPSNIRSRMNNDPNTLLAFMSDPDNEEEAISLGLIPAKIVPKPTETIEPVQNATTTVATD